MARSRGINRAKRGTIKFILTDREKTIWANKLKVLVLEE